MPVYYRGPYARITHEVIEVRCPTYKSYAFRDLSHAWIERMGAPAVRPIGAGSAGMAGAVAVILALGHSAGWAAFDSPLALIAALAIFVASVVVARACWQGCELDQRIVGVYQNREVIIYRDPYPKRFAQVVRALNRALEHAEDGR